MAGEGRHAGDCSGRVVGKGLLRGGARRTWRGKTPRKPVHDSDVSRRDGTQGMPGKEREVEEVGLGRKAHKMGRFEGTMVESPAGRSRRKKQRMSMPRTERACYYCGTSSTAQWRSGPVEFPVLCNACGVRHRKGKLKTRGGLSFSPREYACASSSRTMVSEPPQLTSFHTWQTSLERKDLELFNTKPASSLAILRVVKQSRSGSNSGSSGESGEAVIAMSDARVFPRVPALHSSHDQLMQIQHLSDLKWGSKRKRSGWE